MFHKNNKVHVTCDAPNEAFLRDVDEWTSSLPLAQLLYEKLPKDPSELSSLSEKQIREIATAYTADIVSLLKDYSGKLKELSIPNVIIQDDLKPLSMSYAELKDQLDSVRNHNTILQTDLDYLKRHLKSLNLTDNPSITARFEPNDYGKLSARRGVTLGFLLSWTKERNCWDLRTEEVVEKFIKPETETLKCRYIELPSMQASGVVGKTRTFISHTWGAKWGGLVAAVLDGDASLDRIVWIDIFAIKQWPINDPLEMQLELDFGLVIRECESFLIVCSYLEEVETMDEQDLFSRNSKKLSFETRRQIAFLRSWCLAEMDAALNYYGIAIIMKCGEYNYINGQLTFIRKADMLGKLSVIVNIRNAEAKFEADRKRILDDVEKSKGGIDGLNARVRSAISGGRICIDNPILQCAACGDEIAIENILMDPNSLVFVCGGGYMRLVDKLLNKGVNIETTNSEGFNALKAASRGGHRDCVSLLLNKGAVVNAMNEGDFTALMEASIGGHSDCVSLLLNMGANVNSMACDGLTALFAASIGGHHDCVSMLLNKGANVNIIDHEGRTALFAACLGGYSTCVSLLLDNNAEVNLRDSEEGKTAYEYAEAGGHTECMNLLLLKQNKI